MSALTYCNFDLLVEPFEDGYRARVLDSPVGEEKSALPLADSILAMDAAVRGCRSETEVRSLGAELFATVVVGAIESCYRRSLDKVQETGQGLRLRLRLNDVPALAVCPWEYLFDAKRGEFLATSTDTPIVRYLEMAEPQDALPGELPLRILALAAQPTDQIHLDLNAELDKLESTLESLISEGLVVIDRLPDGTLATLQRQLRTRRTTDRCYHVFHFLGHGWRGDADDEGGLILEDADRQSHYVSLSALGNHLRDHPTFRLAFLNACHTGSGQRGNIFGGTAQHLIQRRMPAVIAMQFAVEDQAACTLAMQFYQALVEGYPVDAALAEARKYLHARHHVVEWGNPVLFSRASDSQLFSFTVADGAEDEEETDRFADFRPRESETARLAAIYAAPSSNLLADARAVLERHRVLLLHGELGTGKRALALRLGLDLVADRRATELLRPLSTTPLSELDGLTDAVLILSDAFGVVHFQRDDLERDQRDIDNLAQRNHVILTTGNQAFEEALANTRLDEWEPIKESALEVSADLYSNDDYLEIVRKHLQWSLQEGRVSEKQARWLFDVLDADRQDERVRALTELRLPVDLKRLVDDHLPALTSADELLPAIRRIANVVDELRAWFRNPGVAPEVRDDLQCFIFTLALFDGFGRDQLWLWYRKIVNRLRPLHPRLATRPLGLLVAEASPFVCESNDEISFAHPSVQRAALSSVAELYREYFLELRGEFLQASLPPGDNRRGREVRGREHGKSRPWLEARRVRQALAPAAGAVGAKDLADVEPFFDKWAASSDHGVRLAACELLVRSAESPLQSKRVLELLKGWSKTRDRALVGRRWTAAVSYGRLAERHPQAALAGLSRLASDPDLWVRGAVARAVQPLVPLYPEKTQRLLTKLAADKYPRPRRECSTVLRAMAGRSADYVANLLDSWETKTSKRRQWTLYRVCWLVRGQLPDVRAAILSSGLSGEKSDQDLLSNALADALDSKDLRPASALDQLELMLQHDPYNARRLAQLASLIKKPDADLVWQRLERWAHSDSGQVRLAAADIVSHWKTQEPERASAILARLAADINDEVSVAAQLDPLVTIPDSFFEDVLNRGLADEDAMVPPRIAEQERLEPWDFASEILD